MLSISPRDIYGIFDLPHSGGLAPRDVIKGLFAGGCCVVQMRAKMAETSDRIQWSQCIGPYCEKNGINLWINDDVDAACARVPGVVGVHLGQDDLSLWSRASLQSKLDTYGLGLGISTHNYEQVIDALTYRPTYIAYGPIFHTFSKANPDPATGISELASICRLSDLPVVAIGGISRQNISECRKAGAQSAAAISSLNGNSVEEIRQRSWELINAWNIGGPVS